MLDGWWLPAAISRHANAHDGQFVRTMVAALLIFVLAQLALLVLAWRNRESARAAGGRTHPFGARTEFVAIAVTSALFLGLLAMGAQAWANVQFTDPPANAERVDVLGRQFAWNFRYPGVDGRFGRTDIRFVNEAAGNPFGLDDSDSASKDDIVSATLRVPAGRPVLLTLRTLDVVHSFFVRELRVKQDLVPGMSVPLHFVAEVPGTYEVPCSELCGLGHHQMRTAMIVMPPAAFDSWKREQAR